MRVARPGAVDGAISAREEARSGVEPSLWRAGPRRFARLLAGLVLFGAGEAMLIASHLGNTPWSVLAAGFGGVGGFSVGTATILISGLVLLAWIPLGVRPGVGTIANAVVVGLAIDLVLAKLADPSSLAVRYGFVLGGIGLVGIGSALYLGARLGPGPRDGMWLGIQRRSGLSGRTARTIIEVTAVAAGAALGGRAGIGTVAFALLIGPAVQVSLRLMPGDAPRTRQRPVGGLTP